MSITSKMKRAKATLNAEINVQIPYISNVNGVRGFRLDANGYLMGQSQEYCVTFATLDYVGAYLP